MVERSSFTSALYISARLREQAQIMTLHDHVAHLRMVHFDPHQMKFDLPTVYPASFPAAGGASRGADGGIGQDGCAMVPLRERRLDMPFLIGCAYLHIGEATKSRQQFAKSLEAFGSRPAVLFQMGQADFKSGEQAKGASMAREALRADPSVGGFLERLGIGQKKKHGEEERSAAGDAGPADPDDAEARAATRLRDCARDQAAF
jgi:hypothetical protein